MVRPLSFFLIEGDPEVCDAISRCAGELQAQVIGRSVQGSAAVEMIGQLKPDYAIVDTDMPDVNAAEVIRLIREVHPATRVIAVSASRDKAIIRQLFHRGARGYILKESLEAEFNMAIRAVHAQSLYLSPGLGHELR